MELVVLVLSAALLALVFSVCGKKALRLLCSLLLTIAVLIWGVTPLIVHGYSPELVVILLGLPLLACIVYLTEGFTALSHLSIVGVAINFLCISLLVHVAVLAAHFTGATSTDDSFLGLAGINLQQLLSAGIMLGTLGILTEMVVTQVATVLELMQASPEADSKQLFKNAYSVGIAHLGSIINTLFLVYAGVSFPLLIVYAGGGSSLYDALNYEPLVSRGIMPRAILRDGPPPFRLPVAWSVACLAATSPTSWYAAASNP